MAVVNLGTVEATGGGMVTIDGASFTNGGTLRASGGGTLTVQSAAVTNFAAGTLTGGAWEAVNATLRVTLPGAVTTNAAAILLDGAGARFYRDAGTTEALSALAANAAAGRLTLRNGTTLAPTGAFVNAGTLAVESGATFAPAGGFTQTAGATALAGGTLGAPTPPAGSALRFKGVDDLVAVADSPSLRPASLTAEAWVNFSALPSNVGSIFGKTVGSGTLDSFAVWYQNGNLNAGVSSASALDSGGFAWNPPLNTWHHVALTFDDAADALTLYLDGVAVLSRVVTLAIAYDGHPLLLGADTENQALNLDFPGRIADFRLWDSARPAAAIRAAMGRTLTGTEPGLLAYLPLDEGAGTTAADRTANGNAGTLGGGTAAARPAWVAVDGGRIGVLGGTLGGTGVVNGNLTNAGTVAPGSPVGALTVLGSYAQSAAGTLAVELAGVAAGTGYDLLAVGGAAALGGTLAVSRRGGFNPTTGDAFRVLTFAGRTGQFAAVTRLTAPGGASLRANTTDADVILFGEAVGIKVNPTSGLVTTQAGGAATFAVVLDARPTAAVTVGVSSSDIATGGTVSAGSLTLTPENWDAPQTVTVTGADDFVDRGDVGDTVRLARAVSADPAFDGFDPSDVAVVNRSSHRAGVTIAPVSGLTTTGAGGTATFTAALG